jgi:hypothetical protein
MPKFKNDPVISNTTAPSGVDNYNGGVVGTSTLFNGVLGYTTAEGHAGVAGACDEGNGNGVYGRSKNRNGVYGVSSAKDHSGVVGGNETGTAVLGRSISGNGVWGLSDTGIGVVGQTRSTTGPALAAYQSNPNSNWAAFHAKHDGGVNGGKLAAVFEGDIEVTGDIRLKNADCAEDFDILNSIEVEPGTVMVLGDSGGLAPCKRAYDKRVAGVISGAGNYKPGIVLDKQESAHLRRPVALLGKVFCLVDAQLSAIEVGDMLTTSSTSGHAMKARNRNQAFGAVIGKALEPMEKGRGLISILVALQ